MSYIIKRGEAKYGPYTLAEVQKYVQSGNISLSDLAQSEGIDEWYPVSQVIGNIPATPVPPAFPVYSAQPRAQNTGTTQNYSVGYAVPAGYSAGAVPYGATSPVEGYVPLPSGMHWALVFLLGFCTFGLFPLIWIILQANWVRKFRGKSSPLVLLILYPVIFIVGEFFNFAGIASVAAGNNSGAALLLVGELLLLAGFVIFLVAIFGIRGEMQYYYNNVENINLRLSGVMTFFFNVLYFQYHITRISNWKKTGMLN